MTEITSRLSTALADRYKIERHLGEGGMATVYLAEDLKHKRKVAVKVLRPELAAVLGAERFVQEITTTANLQHPHILPLFDSGEADSFLYYVMPYIEGETLRDKLNRETQLGIDEAVRITTEVADALDYAHRHNVIHRDIKPENILLHDGRPMVADFGIALAVSAAAGGRMTETGLSLGTPHYMSPEQATAEKDLTNRSDVYSLGSVLYEMLTGNPPHVGASAQQIIMKIVTEEAQPVTALRKSVPPNVTAAVAKALEKLPADRFDGAKAFADALADSGFTTAAATTRVAPARFTRSHRLVLAAAALSPVLLVAALWGWLRPAVRDAVVPMVETRLYPGGGVTIVTREGLALSPSGDRLAFVGQDSAGTTGVWIRPLDDEEPAPVSGGENGIWPFWSADGHSLAFTSGGRLQAVDLASGTVRMLCETDDVNPAGTWSSTGVILFRHRGIIHRTHEEGGDCLPVTRPGEPPGRHDHPSFLADGRHFLFSTAASATLYVGDMETGEHEVLIATGARNAQFVRPNWVLHSGSPVGGVDARGLLTLMAQRIDLRTHELIGDPGAVFTGIVTPGGAASYAAAENGVLVAVRRTAGPPPPLVWVTRDGVVADTVPRGSGPWTFASSADGGRVALGGWGTWIHDLDRGVSERLSLDGPERGITYRPAWSPGDSMLSFTAFYPEPAELRLYHLRDGSVKTVIPAAGNSSRIPGSSWSPDGGEIAFWRLANSGSRNGEMWVYSLASGEQRMLFETRLASRSRGNSLEFSPDGRWLLYAAGESGSEEVYLRSYPALGAPRRVSSNGGSSAYWSADGRTIFYLSATDQVVAVSVGADPGATLGAPRVVLASDRHTGLWGVSRDGRRFLRQRQPSESNVPPLRVVTGWPERALRAAGGGGGGDRR